MRPPWEWSYPELLLGVLSIVVVAAVIVALSTSTVAFGLYSAQWDGASELRAITEEGGSTYRVAESTPAYERLAPNDSVALLMAPNQPYDQAAVARIQNYVRAGGTLVVAADFGEVGNALLADLGADARVAGTLLRDERHYYRAPALPVATNVNDSPFTTGMDQLTLNHGSPVRPGDARVLVSTAPSAYVDRNRNGSLDASEVPRARPVVTAEGLGQGQVIVVGDPSVFINAMLERSGNRQFVRVLTDERGVVLLDTSHTATLPPLVGAVLALRDSPLLQGLLVAVLLVALWRVPRDPESWYRERFGDAESLDVGLSRAELRAVVERRHPDWDADRIERVVKGVTRTRVNDPSDE